MRHGLIRGGVLEDAAAESRAVLIPGPGEQFRHSSADSAGHPPSPREGELRVRRPATVGESQCRFHRL